MIWRSAFEREEGTRIMSQPTGHAARQVTTARAAARALGLALLLWLLATSLVRANEVVIEGLEGAMLNNARQYTNLYKRKDDENLSERWRNNLHADALQEISESLHPFGYYKAVVESLPIEQTEQGWRALYKVTLGEPVRVGVNKIAWRGEGAGRPELTKAIEEFPLKKGDILVHKIYEKGKATLLDTAYELGYVKVRPVEHQVRVNLEKNSAAIHLTVDTGLLYRFGEITLRQDLMDPDLLQHYVTLEPGAPYSNEQLQEFQRSLTSSGWFSVVQIKPDFDAVESAEVPINVDFTAAKRHRVEFGLGFATDVGVRGSTRWTNRRVNRSGHQANANLKLAPVKGSLSAGYQIPVVDPRTDRLAFTTTYEYEELNDTDRDTLNTEVAFLRTTLDQQNYFKLFSEFRYERFSASVDEETITKLLPIGAIARRTVAEEAKFPRRGYSISADLRGASSTMLSDTSFMRGDFSGVYLLPVGEHGRIYTRGQFATAWVDDFSKYPTSLRFFAGGDQSVRGYNYKDLGPRDENDLVVGGKHLLVGHLEYDHRVGGNWVGAAFVDAGNAYNSTFDQLFVGAGIGVRWLAPFGSVRLDLAWPVSENPEFSDIHIHLGLGAVL